MIVSPSKGVFFLATALMCSASLYGAELTSPSNDPLTRIFIGEPNRLTLPPGFSDDSDVLVERDENCAPQIADRGTATLQTASASSQSDCRPEEKPALGAIVLPGAVTALAPEVRADVKSASVGGTVRSH